MIRHVLIGLALVSVAGAAFAGPAADERSKPSQDQAAIAALVEQLDSNRYLERERATRALLDVGRPALDPLVAAANGDRPEAADRAVWILRKFADSDDRDFALAALDRLVQLKGRTTVVAAARETQRRLKREICEEQLTKLGARVTFVDFLMPDAGPVELMRVELGDGWHGTVDDLKCLLTLDQEHYFRLVGSAVDDEEIKLFEGKDGLQLLQVFMAHVTPPAIDRLKERQPAASVFVRNRALLGIGGQSHPQSSGVVVVRVQDGALAAGIAVGDVVTKIDGKPIPDFDRLTALVAQYKPGDEVNVTVLRGEEVLTKRIVLGDMPPE
jgi:PDZ domain